MTDPESQIEREVKLGVWPGFRMPELIDVDDDVSVEVLPTRTLDATYYDTPDVRLGRIGITLRHRSGEGNPKWTLKLPADQRPIDGLSRREISVDGAPGPVPSALADLVASRVRTAVLAPVAHLQTVRQGIALSDADGKVLAEVVDDEVSVLDGEHLALRFREVEVEVSDAAPDRLLEVIVGRLRDAGADAPDPTPKVVRALGPIVSTPPELGNRELPHSPSAADVLARGFTKAVRRLIEHDPIVREDADLEGVHQARVATRRLRSDLRVFGTLVDAAWARSLRDELAWLAGVLGEVRDADVLLVRLERQIDGLAPPDRAGGRELVALLRDQRTARLGSLREALSSPRYLELLDRLVDAAVDPRVLPGASKPADDVLPGLVRRPWRALSRAADRTTTSSPDAELHEVRILAKRARYAADVATVVCGAPARRFAEAMADVQTVLGDHQDAHVAEQWLREAAQHCGPPGVLAAGQLMAVQRGEASVLRLEWPKVWERSRKGTLRAWLTQ